MCSAFITEVTSGKQKIACKGKPLVHIDTGKQKLRHIPAEIQELTDTLCDFFPSHGHCHAAERGIAC